MDAEFKVIEFNRIDDSIEDESIQYGQQRKETVISDFAIKNMLPKTKVEDLVQEYEFSGIIDKEDVSDTLVKAEYSFLENVKKSSEIVMFIKEVAQEYN